MTIVTTGSKISSQDLIDEAKLAGKIPELIQGVIRRQAIERHVRAAKIELTSAELQAAADQFRLLHKLESIETTNQWLAANLLSLDDFEQIITQSLITHKLAQHLFGDRVEQFFFQNQLNYHSAIISEIIFPDQNLAIEIFYSIQEGDLNFTEVAREYIVDPELRRRGGYLVDPVSRKQLHPDISAAVFAAKPPQLIEPIVTDIGVHLIQVEEIIQPQLDEQLYQRILTELFEQWLATERVEILPEILIEI